MIDKVELRVPHFLPYSPEFASLYRDLRNDPKGPFRPSQHYARVADLRDYGHPVILHTHNVHDKRGNHKLELIDTGDMAYSQMVNAASRIFDVGIEPLVVMRVDLAADIAGVPVTWFEKHVRAQFKRWTWTGGEMSPDAEFAKMGKTGVETIYFGRRPNVFRVYDKVAERRNEYARLKMKARRERWDLASVPTFEEFSGFPAGYVLTRVERQMGGGRVPKQLATFRSLRNAAEFNPFQRLVFAGGGQFDPNPEDYELMTYLAGLGLRSLIAEQGIHRTKQFINRRTERNAGRVLRQLAAFLPVDSDLVTAQALFERYQLSISRQLAA